MSESFVMTFGTVEPIVTYRFENGRMVSYSHAIHRDQHGVITKITTPEVMGSLGYDNGEPFTEKEYNKTMGISFSSKTKNLLRRLVEVFCLK